MKKMIVIASALLVMGRAFGADTGAPTQSQTVCPVMGGKISKNLFVDHDGKRIYVCCKGCLPDLKQDPGKYIKKLEQQGVKLDAATPAADAKK